MRHILGFTLLIVTANTFMLCGQTNSIPGNPVTINGRLGIGTTDPKELVHVSVPNGNFYGGIRFGQGLMLGREGANDVWLFSNSSSSTSYLSSAEASGYAQFLGYHGWHTAPGGTAGTPIPFTERMRLSNAGGLSLGSAYVGIDPGAGSMIISGSVGIRTTNLTSALTVNGVVESGSGGFKFLDGSIQTRAAVGGTQGPPGPQGSQGPTGPPGLPVHTSAVCASNVSLNQAVTSSCRFKTVSFSSVPGGSCNVTADTGSCSAGASASQFGQTAAVCAVCSPN